MSDDEYEYEYDEDDDGDGDGGGDGMDEDDNEGNNNDDTNNDFEYTDEEEDHDDSEVALENAYYNAKGLREVDLLQADSAFESVIQMEQSILEKASGKSHQYGQWSYKAMKQLVKLNLRASSAAGGTSTTFLPNDPTAIGTPARILKHYNSLLECVSTGDVSPAAVEKGISGMLERVARAYGVSSSNSMSNAMEVESRTETLYDQHQEQTHSQRQQQKAQSLQTSPQSLALAVYDATLTVFHPVTGPFKNERLWFKTNLKYGQLLYEMNETSKLQQVLKELISIHNRCNNDDGNSDGAATKSSSYGAIKAGVGSNNSTNSMEIYALQIQLYSRQKDLKKLRETYQRAITVMGGIPHPRTLALIHELGGKMHMSAREYENAGKTFFQAFKSYDEAGDVSRLRCLKYLVLASMLHASTINPFDSQEARPYRDDPEIVTMTELVSAFHNNDIKKFETILKKNSKHVLGDEFIREHIEDLLRTIRTQVLCRIIRPYNRISLEAIASELNDIPVRDVEQLLVHQILQGNLVGARIDRVNNILLKAAEKGGIGGYGGFGSTADTTAAASASTSSASNSSQHHSSSSTPLHSGLSSTSNGVDGAISTMIYNNKSDVILQCEAMDSMIAVLDELAVSLTSVSFLNDTAGVTATTITTASTTSGSGSGRVGPGGGGGYAGFMRQDM